MPRYEVQNTSSSTLNAWNLEKIDAKSDGGYSECLYPPSLRYFTEIIDRHLRRWVLVSQLPGRVAFDNERLDCAKIRCELVPHP
jgi:hypothetical protein